MRSKDGKEGLRIYTFIERFVVPVLMVLMWSGIEWYHYRREKQMPCRPYLKYKYASYILMIVVMLIAFLWSSWNRVTGNSSGMPIVGLWIVGMIGWMFLLERAYRHLISYMQEHGWRDYDGRSIGMYRFMLWSIRWSLAVFSLAVVVSILLLI